MLVRDRMTSTPITVTPETSIGEAQALMREKKVHRFPVLDKKGELAGIVSESDLLNAGPSAVTTLSIWEITYQLSQITVGQVMTRRVITVDEDCPIEDAARLMRQNNIGGTPVMRDRQLVGIITESDIFDVFLELLMADEAGVRLTVLAPYFKGSLAQIASAVTAKGGLIHSLNTFKSHDPSTWGCVMKVADLSCETLEEVVRPLVVKILDVRCVDA